MRRTGYHQRLTIGFSYIIGGLIPLTPYILIAKSTTALRYSVTSTLVALLIFGYTKGRFTVAPSLQSALQTALIGGLCHCAAHFVS